jgi:hypothetical protein
VNIKQEKWVTFVTHLVYLCNIKKADFPGRWVTDKQQVNLKGNLEIRKS